MREKLDFWQQEITAFLPLLLITFFSGVFAYFYELSNFSFSIDEESFCNSVNTWNVHGPNTGRYGLVFINKIILYNTLPYINTAITILFVSIAACMISKKCRFGKHISIIFCVSMVSFPQLAHQIEFIFQSVACGIGIFISSIVSILIFNLFYRTKIVDYIVCIVLYSFVISIYQSFIFVVPILIVMFFIVNTIECGCKYKFILKSFAIYIVITVLSFGLYYLISNMTYSINTSYASIFYGWRGVDSIIYVWNSLYMHILGKGYIGEYLYILVIPASLVLVFYVFTHNFEKKCISIILLIVLPFLPFLQIIIFGQNQPARTLLAQGITFSFIISLFCQKYKIHSFLIYILSIFILIFSTIHITNLFHNDLQQLERDKILGVQISSRLSSLENITHQTKIIFYGIPQNHRIEKSGNYEVFKSSFFVHDGGNMVRIKDFMNTYHMLDFNLPTKNEVLERVPLIEKMPIWPHPDSIQKIDDIWVVKLGHQVPFLGILPQN